MTATTITTTPAEEPPAAACGDSAEPPAAIIALCRDPSARNLLGRELLKRYGADYQVVVCNQPADLEPQMQSLLAAGVPIALVIGGVGPENPDGIEVLATVRRIDPTAVRVATVRWGDWESVRSIFEAVSLGQIDHWVTGPVQTPAEEFHRSVTEFLREWRSRRAGSFEAVRVIGKRWSARSQELRDILARHRVPTGFYDVSSDCARYTLREVGIEPSELPVVVLQFGAERTALVNPSNIEIADAFGLMTPIGAEDVFDVAIVGAGPAGLAAAAYASRRACARLSSSMRRSAVRPGRSSMTATFRVSPRV